MRSHNSVHVPLRNTFLTLLFSKKTLKRKDFQEIARLAWAQKVPSSNPGAPATYLQIVSTPNPELSV